MSKELKDAYSALRAKDEVMAEAISAIPAAICVAIMGLVALVLGAWICAVVAISCALACGLWPYVFAKVVDWYIRRLGYSETDLERWALA